MAASKEGKKAGQTHFRGMKGAKKNIVERKDPRNSEEKQKMVKPTPR